MEKRRMTSTTKLKKMKESGVPISMITAYDYPSAQLSEEAGIDLILVGDSLGNVVLGYDSTIPVTIDDMLHHTKMVSRGAPNTFIITDLPFMTYHGSIDETLRNVSKIMQVGLAKSVKVEGGKEIVPTVEAIVNAGVPVMGHIGLTPQSVYQLGGYKVQGKDSAEAQKLLEDAKALEQAGAFAIVLELVTDEIATFISEQLSIPTVGIGSGSGCDGQVLVFHDLLQYHAGAPAKKFVKTYANIGEQIRNGIQAYIKDVKEKSFPEKAHSFQTEHDVVHHLYGNKES